MFFRAATKLERTIRNVFWTTGVVTLFYFLDINFNYKTDAYNFVLLPCILAWALAPVLYWLSKKVVLTGWYVFVTAALLISVFIYAAGGFHASGVFWIAIIPLLGGFIFEKLGLWWGFVMALASYLFFAFTEPFWGLPKFVAMQENYQNEKFTDVTLFCLTIFFFTYHFLTTRLQAEQEALVQKNKFDGLLSMLIHDIAGPVGAIQMSAESATRNPLRIESSLARIEKQAQHLTQLITGIREMKSAADLKVSIKVSPASVLELVHETLEIFQDRARAKGVTLHFVNTQDCSPTVLVEGSIFKASILGNLISNAIKFSASGTVIDVVLSEQSGEVILEVQDRGVGMPTEMVTRLFEPNAKTTRLGTAGEKGTGYGLIMVKQWLELMNGQIQVSSKTQEQDPVDHGTTFQIRLSKID